MIGNVVGNYRIEREIGEGGMSHVYVGRTHVAHRDPARRLPGRAESHVARSWPATSRPASASSRKRTILSKLRHRYITRFYEFINNDDGAVLVMEFVEGTPVDVLLTERGALPLADAIAIASACSKRSSTRTAKASCIATSSRPT